MNDIPFKCLVGLSNCWNVNALNITGAYVRWFQILSLAGIVFAISQFIEGNKLRTYLLKRKRIAWPFYALIFSSIISIIIATVLTFPLIPAEPIPFLSFPAFWELLSLLCFSIVILEIILVSVFPQFFIPKYNRRGYQDIWDIAVGAVLYDGSAEAISALCKVIYRNRESIIKEASKYDRYWEVKGSKFKSPFEKGNIKKKGVPRVQHAVRLIDEILSHDSFCKFVVQRNLAFVAKLIELAEETKLWNSCGYFFFNNMFKWLFEDPESLLSQELKASGTGYSQPLSNHVFKAFGVIANYGVFQSFGQSKVEKLTDETIKKVCHGLRLSLKEYFKKPQLTMHGDNPRTALGLAIEDLAGIISSICMNLVSSGRETWLNPFRDLLREISVFFDHTLPRLLPNEEINLSEDDNITSKGSMLEWIGSAIFDYLEGLSWLKNTEFARYESTSLFWILFPHRDQIIVNKMRVASLEKIKERIKENKEQYYPSMVRLLLDVYAFQFPTIIESNEIGKYIQDEFYTEIAVLALRSEENAKYFLPSHWKWDLAKKSITSDKGKMFFPTSINP